MSFDSFCLWHASECRRRLRDFMTDRARRRIAEERRDRTWRLVHDAEPDNYYRF